MTGVGRTARRVLLLGIVVAAGAWWLWPPPSDEDRVRAVIGAMAAGAEEGDVGDVMDHVSARFEGGDAVDAETLRAALLHQFLRRGPLSVLLGPVAVSVRGDRAHAAFDATILERGDGALDVLPVDGDAWHLEAEFVREEGDVWRVIGATRRAWSEGER